MFVFLIVFLNKARIRFAPVLVLFACLTFCHFPLTTEAQVIGSTTYESYYSRPDVLSLDAKSSDLGRIWERLKTAHFSFVAFLLELYPADTEFYFLARDGEFLYDVARLVTANTPEAKRIHLLNVSRGNVGDPLLEAYLADNGITESTLLNGKSVVMIDTGFMGTIIDAISKKFSESARNRIKGHLILSGTAKYPDSRTFMVNILPTINSQNTAVAKGALETYEFLPRYTDRSARFELRAGHIHPMSAVESGSDGAVSKFKSILYMKDLKFTWTKSATQANFLIQRKRFRTIKSAITKSPHEAVKARVSNWLTSTSGFARAELESILRDFITAAQNAGIGIEVTPEDFGFVTNPQKFEARIEVLQHHPEWYIYLSDPAIGIPKLFAAQDWATIELFFDLELGRQTNELLIKELFDQPALGAKLRIQQQVILESSASTLELIVQHLALKINPAYVMEMLDLVDRSIARDSVRVWQSLASYFFRTDVDQKIKLLNQLIATKDTNTVMLLIGNVSWTVGTKDILIELLNNAEQISIKSLLDYGLLSGSFRPEFADVFIVAMQKATPDTLRNVLAIHRSGSEETVLSPAQDLIIEGFLRIHDPVQQTIFLKTEFEKLSHRRDRSIPKYRLQGATCSEIFQVH